MTAPRYGFWQWADDNAPVALILGVVACMAFSSAFNACGRPSPPAACADKLVYGSSSCEPGQTIEETTHVLDERPYYVCRCPGSKRELQPPGDPQ